jgi:osmotically-inducible protein OsmY
MTKVEIGNRNAAIQRMTAASPAAAGRLADRALTGKRVYYVTMLPTPFLLLRRAVQCATVFALLAAAGCGRADSDVQASVKNELARDPRTAPLALVVVVENGVATIGGETLTIGQQERALELARAVDGVKEVRNEMAIEGAVLIEAVKKALAEDAALAAVPIKVDFKDGKVRLISDQTDRAQRERAVAIARAVEGVEELEDRMK